MACTVFGIAQTNSLDRSKLATSVPTADPQMLPSTFRHPRQTHERSPETLCSPGARRHWRHDDQGVISGALPGIEAAFSLSLLMVQVVTSWVTLGALLGSLAGGELADRLGRKRTVLIAGALFALGAAVQYFTPNAAILVVARLVIGAGVDVAAVAAPLYAAELAPAPLRGRFVSGYQMAITIGIFLAYLVNGLLAAETDWRLMLGAAAVPGLALFIVGLFAPESPRWLMLKNCRADAAAELRRIEPDSDIEPRLDAVEATLAQDANAAGWGELFHAKWRRPLMVAIGLAVFQQVTGINAIIYYANQIFASAGFATEAARARHALGDRRCERAGHADRDRLHRQDRAAQAVDGRAPRHGREPRGGRHGISLHRCRYRRCRGRGRGVSGLRCGVSGVGRTAHGRHGHRGGAGGIHHLLRVLARARDLDGDQRGVSGAHSQP